MGFDLFAAVMAFLSVVSFGAFGGADVGEELPQIEILSGVTDTKPQTGQSAAIPEMKPGAELITGKWIGKSSIPFMVSVVFYADAHADGTAQFSGTVTSAMFGDHVFDTPAKWEYLGENSFDVLIESTHTPVSCSGKTLTFPLNPYKLGLVDAEIANQEFVINLERAA